MAKRLATWLGQLGSQTRIPNRQIVQLLGGILGVLARFVDDETNF